MEFSSPLSQKRSTWLYGLLCGWALCVIAGLAVMFGYELTPATTLPADGVWPADTRLLLDAGRPTLVMFVHPRCPCSRASLAELERLAMRTKKRLAMHVVFLRPAAMGSNWERTDLWRSAERIPGVVVHCDVDGQEAARFAATTSGETRLYAVSGEKLFEGGITSSRGHEGDNAGRDALTTLVISGDARHRQTAVFGCALFSHDPLNKETQDQSYDATRN